MGESTGKKPSISVLGAGRMGSALVRALLARGYTTSIWNRTRSRSEPLSAQGARIAETVHDAVAAAEIVIVCVNDYGATDRLLRPDDVVKALRGKLLVQLTSGTPRQAREAAAWAQQHEIQYLDGAIMATPDLIGDPACTILYAGSGELFDRYKPVLLTLGGNAIHLGSDAGHASALDSALLVFMWGSLFGALQGVSVCEAEGLPLDTYLGSVKALLPVVDGAAADLMQRIRDGRLVGGDTLATVAVHQGALHHLIALCKEHGIHRGVPEAFDQLLQTAVDAGHGQDDLAVLSKFMR